jgi:hypothetical protein
LRKLGEIFIMKEEEKKREKKREKEREKRYLK